MKSEFIRELVFGRTEADEEAPKSLAAYLVSCERTFWQLGVDQDEIARLRTLLRERMTETRIALTEEDLREYAALTKGAAN